jgi:hypothetical protein
MRHLNNSKILLALQKTTDSNMLDIIREQSKNCGIIIPKNIGISASSMATIKQYYDTCNIVILPINIDSIEDIYTTIDPKMLPKTPKLQSL